MSYAPLTKTEERYITRLQKVFDAMPSSLFLFHDDELFICKKKDGKIAMHTHKGYADEYDGSYSIQNMKVDSAAGMMQ